VKWRVIIGPRAERDVAKARSWYEKQQIGLGDRFVQEVGQAVLALKNDADRFPLYYRRFRRVLLPRFPYKIFFILDGDRALVFRVLHAKREHHRQLSSTQT
jgi:plasmid stabilization system protein ParE